MDFMSTLKPASSTELLTLILAILGVAQALARIIKTPESDQIDSFIGKVLDFLLSKTNNSKVNK